MSPSHGVNRLLRELECGSLQSKVEFTISMQRANYIDTHKERGLEAGNPLSCQGQNVRL